MTYLLGIGVFIYGCQSLLAWLPIDISRVRLKIKHLGGRHDKDTGKENTETSTDSRPIEQDLWRTGQRGKQVYRHVSIGSH